MSSHEAGHRSSDASPMFHDVLENVLEDRPLGHTLDLIARRVTELAGFDFCAIVLPDDTREHVGVAGSYNFPPRYIDRANLVFSHSLHQLELSPTARAFAERETVIVTDTFEDPSYSEWKPLAVEFGFRSIVCVPLSTRGHAVGVLNGYSRHPREYVLDDLIAVETLARQASLALRVTMLVETRQATIDELQTANGKLEKQRAVLERAHQIHLGLTDAVLEGADFGSVAAILAELLDRGVAVTDPGGQITAHSDPRPEWATTPFAGQEPEFIVAPIRIGTDVLGGVVVTDGTDESRALDRRAAEHAATVLALHVVKTRATRATEARLRSDFLADVLSGREPESRVRERSAHYGLEFGREHRIVSLLVDDPSVAADEVSARSRHAQVGGLVSAAVHQRHSTALVSQVGGLVTIAVPAEGAGGEHGLTGVRTFATEVGRVLRRQLPGLRTIAGIGGAAVEPTDFVASHVQAQRCVTLLRRLGRWDAVTAIDDLGILGLFVENERPEQLVELSTEVLAPLDASDERGGGALVATLEGYLDNRCNPRDTAAAMFVHVNTVKYRLRRIESLCAVDFRDPDDLLKLKIALLARTLLGPTT